MRIVKLDENSKKNVLENMLKRSPNNYGDFQDKVDAILKDVKEKGDEALFEYTKKFDGFDLNADNIVVTDEEIEEAYKEVEKTGLVDADYSCKKWVYDPIKRVPKKQLNIPNQEDDII